MTLLHKTTAQELHAAWAHTQGVVYPEEKAKHPHASEEDLIAQGYLPTHLVAERMHRSANIARNRLYREGAEPIVGMLTGELYWRRNMVEKAMAKLPQHPPASSRTASELSFKEVEEMLGCSKSTVSRLLRRGKITPRVVMQPSVVGDRVMYLFNKAEVEKLAESRQNAPEE